MHADEKVHAVIRNDSRHDLVACAGRQCCHENHRIKRVMHILTAEEIQPFCLHILFESIRFQILMPNLRNGVTLSVIKTSTLSKFIKYYIYYTGYGRNSQKSVIGPVISRNAAGAGNTTSGVRSLFCKSSGEGNRESLCPAKLWKQADGSEKGK